jgi:hypothetical protein
MSTSKRGPIPLFLEKKGVPAKSFILKCTFWVFLGTTVSSTNFNKKEKPDFPLPTILTVPPYEKYGVL